MNKYEKFWLFFKNNERYLGENLITNPDDVAFLVHEELKSIDDDLAFELYEDTEKDNLTFIVSADGNIELFSEVDELFRYVPSIKGWDIIKFRPALNEFYQVIELDGISLKYDDVYFKYELVGDQIDINVYISGLVQGDNRYIHAYFLLLDTLIGEYDAVMRIRNTEVNLLVDKKNLYEFRELKNIILSLK